MEFDNLDIRSSLSLLLSDDKTTIYISAILRVPTISVCFRFLAAKLHKNTRTSKQFWDCFYHIVPLADPGRERKFAPFFFRHERTEERSDPDCESQETPCTSYTSCTCPTFLGVGSVGSVGYKVQMTTIIAETAGTIGKTTLLTGLRRLKPTPEPTPDQKAGVYRQKALGFAQKALGFGQKAGVFY